MRCAASAEAWQPIQAAPPGCEGPFSLRRRGWGLDLVVLAVLLCVTLGFPSDPTTPGSRLRSRVPPWRARGHRFGSRPSSRLQSSRARRLGRTPGRPRGLRPLGGLARFRDLRRGSLPARLGLRQFRLLSLSFDFVSDASVSCRRDVSAQALWDRIQRLEEGLNHRLRAARQAGTGAIRFGHFRILRS